MTPLEVIAAKRAHLDRLANQGGAAGEQEVVLASEQWIPRPKGLALRQLIDALAATGVHIKVSSFDALAVNRLGHFGKIEHIRNICRRGVATACIWTAASRPASDRVRLGDDRRLPQCPNTAGNEMKLWKWPAFMVGNLEKIRQQSRRE